MTKLYEAVCLRFYFQKLTKVSQIFKERGRKFMNLFAFTYHCSLTNFVLVDKTHGVFLVQIRKKRCIVIANINAQNN